MKLEYNLKIENVKINPILYLDIQLLIGFGSVYIEYMKQY